VPAAPGARASTPRARSLEKAVEELQKDFEKAMEAVVGAIRQNHSVTEQQMTQAMMANQADLEVQAALAALRAAMNGTEPPKVAAEAEAAKLKTSRRTGKSRRKG
jgi:DNA mismatch repair ATPase MutS